MLSNNFFIFKRNDGLEVSSMELGSIVAKPSISRAKRVIKHISIEGRDSTLTEDTGVYNNTEISFQLINFKENLLEKEILGFLDGSGGQLKLSWLQGWFKVKEVNQFLITEETQGVFKIDLTFVCEPYRYLDSELLTITTNNKSINISGNSKADHITTIYGSGDVSILINDNQIIFKNVEDYITIDTLRLICYKDTTSTNNKMVGDFIKLSPGNNTISWIGNVSKVSINYVGRFLS